jgi:hypothetical protein
MSSQEAPYNNSLPDLIVNQCLFGCEGCPGVWSNSQINHRIICKCVCGHGRIKNIDHDNLGLQGSRIETPASQSVDVATAMTIPTEVKEVISL